jgi:hypothetical protein
MLIYERLVRQIILIFVLFNLCSADIPSKGYFIFTLFTTDTCATRKSEDYLTVIPSNYYCSDIYDEDTPYSVKLLDFDSVSKVLTRGRYANNDCSGSEKTDIEFVCDGTCNSNSAVENYRCVYNDPDEYYFTYEEFSNSCEVANKISSQNLDSSCVVLDGQSLSPAGYDTSDRTVFSILSTDNEKCEISISSELRVLTCDGTCRPTKSNDHYYSCSFSFSSSAYLAFSMITIAFLTILFYIFKC